MSDSTKVIEAHVYDFLKEVVDAVNDPDTEDEDSVFFEAELHRHTYQPFDLDRWFGVRISMGVSTLAPNPDQEMEEFDGSVVVVTFARIKEPDHSDVETARTKAFQLARAVAALFFTEDGVTLGGRVNDARITDCPRDFVEWNGSLYAVCNMPMIINDSGAGG